jgi:hypothetical protein
MKLTEYRSKMRKLLSKAHSGKAHFNKKFRGKVASEIAGMMKYQLDAQKEWMAQHG